MYWMLIKSLPKKMAEGFASFSRDSVPSHLSYGLAEMAKSGHFYVDDACINCKFMSKVFKDSNPL